MDNNILRSYADELLKGIMKGYLAETPKEDFIAIDEKKLQNLRENVYQFSVAKNYQELRQMNDALFNPNGELRTFADFKIAAQNISGKQMSYLKTEYDTAIGGGTMAAKWTKIWEQRKLFPLLQFDAVIDNATSEICKPLDGVILPVEHPFWDKYYPLNHFNCRSTVRQLTSGDITPDDKIIYPTNVPKMFQVNLGKRGLAFPKDHAYFDGIPEELYKVVSKI